MRRRRKQTPTKKKKGEKHEISQIWRNGGRTAQVNDFYDTVRSRWKGSNYGMDENCNLCHMVRMPNSSAVRAKGGFTNLP